MRSLRTVSDGKVCSSDHLYIRLIRPYMGGPRPATPTRTFDDVSLATFSVLTPAHRECYRSSILLLE